MGNKLYDLWYRQRICYKLLRLLGFLIFYLWGTNCSTWKDIYYERDQPYREVFHSPTGESSSCMSECFRRKRRLLAPNFQHSWKRFSYWENYLRRNGTTLGTTCTILKSKRLLRKTTYFRLDQTVTLFVLNSSYIIIWVINISLSSWSADFPSLIMFLLFTVILLKYLVLLINFL